MNEAIQKLLSGPCIFCLFNGEKYWHAGSHGRSCPFHTVAGADVRAKLFIKGIDRVLRLVIAGEKRSNG
jgi:hypothetical protein